MTRAHPKDVLSLFLEQVSAHPDRIAVADNDREVSYRELGLHVSVLAAKVGAHGAHPKVLILLDQGWHAYAAILAVLMAGGVYAPINTQAPAEKISLIAEQFSPDVVLTVQDVRSRFAALQLSAPTIDAADDRGEQLKTPRHPSEVMYVMFTSGSTGVPKGVVIRRDSMAHFIDWVIGEVRPTVEDRWSQHPNIAFDMSHLDIFGCLCTGGTLIPFNTPIDRLMPAKKIRDAKITLWYSVPSAVSMMIQARQLTADHLASVRLMNFAGEALLPEQLAAIFEARPDLEIWNTYGPTEATVTCTLLRARADDYQALSRATVSIGKAIPGMELVLVNGPSSVEGEIVITGPQLAVGYWQNEGQTDKAFREVDVNGRKVRGYYTGDWGQLDGENLYFVGRIDNQVKVRGVRIELGEIDAALRRCGFVDAAAIFHDGRIHAFLEGEVGGQPLDEKSLASRLGEMLVPQAVPSNYHVVSAFPRNSNDKIDRGALRNLLSQSAKVG